MKWVMERDLLIAQTMAFVQSVTGKKPEAIAQVESSFTSVVEPGSIIEPESLNRRLKPRQRRASHPLPGAPFAKKLKAG